MVGAMQENNNNNVLEVEIISKEMVKPSSPTPSHLRIFTLSYVDQIKPISPPLQRPIVMFYPPSHKTQPIDISHLKASLSDALSVFYPLAGRVEQSTITCNDEGIPVFEARVKSPISSLMYSSLKPNLLWKLFPPRESLGIVENQPIIHDLIHLTIQISLFSCGGVAIAWYDIHKIFDGISATNFFKYWAALSSGRHDEAKNFLPNFDMASTIFPPVPVLTAEPLSYVREKKSPAFKCFLFSDSKISQLKIKASTHEVRNPTSFQAVIGFIWEQVLASKTITFDNNEEMTAMSIIIDMRSLIDPPLPNGSIGNLITPAVTLAHVGAGLGGFVSVIHDSIREKQNDIKGYIGENGCKAVRENFNKLFVTLSELKDRVFKVTSWCKLGFYDLDFGFGKPVWVIPTNGKSKGYQQTNSIVLNNYNDSRGHGIEAWLVLEEEDIHNLESNEEFLAFASPVF